MLCYLVQTQLYEDFAKSRAKQGVEDSVTLLESSDSKERKSAGATHVFQVCIKTLYFFSGFFWGVPVLFGILQVIPTG